MKWQRARDVNGEGTMVYFIQEDSRKAPAISRGKLRSRHKNQNRFSGNLEISVWVQTAASVYLSGLAFCFFAH